MTKLRSNEVVIMERLHEVGQCNIAIARTLGVTEGAVRYSRLDVMEYIEYAEAVGLDPITLLRKTVLR